MTNKTQPTRNSVTAFLASVENPKRRADCKTVMAIMRRLTGKRATMWGPSLIGFGRYHYRYASGREGEFFLTGTSPRKAHLVVYIMGGFERHKADMARLGKFKTGKSCLYINKLEDIDLDVLEAVIREDLTYMRNTYETG